MAATIQAQVAHGAGPTLTNAETGIKFNRSDDELGTAPIPIPTAAGTNFSWLKYLALVVTGTGTTSVTNRRVSWATAPATGLVGWFKDQATYTMAASGNMPAAGGANGANPGTYTALSTTPQLWDNTSDSTADAAKTGNYVQLCLGVDYSFAGGAGSATALPDITLTYDEA